MPSAMGQSSLKYAAAKDWNEPPEEILEPSSLSSFENNLRL